MAKKQTDTKNIYKQCVRVCLYMNTIYLCNKKRNENENAIKNGARSTPMTIMAK